MISTVCYYMLSHCILRPPPRGRRLRARARGLRPRLMVQRLRPEERGWMPGERTVRDWYPRRARGRLLVQGPGAVVVHEGRRCSRRPQRHDHRVRPVDARAARHGECIFIFVFAICLTSRFVNRWFPATSWRTAAWRSSTTNGAATACACSTTRRAT